MNKVRIGLILIYCALLYAHFHKIYHHYFEFSNADKVSLAITLVIPYFLSYLFVKNAPLRTKVIGLILLITIPLVIQPIISNLLGLSDYIWISMHILIAVCGVMVNLIQRPQWFLPPIAAMILLWLSPYEYDRSQIKYSDKVIASVETRKGSGQLVQWRSDYWIHYNGNLQFSTIDGHVYKEAFVQPVMHLKDDIRDVLIIGGDNGVLADELAKFSTIYNLKIVPYDWSFYEFVYGHRETLKMLSGGKAEGIDEPIQRFLSDTTTRFDLIIVDLPEPIKIDYKQYYSQSFYALCFNKLNKDGMVVTKSSGSYPQFGRNNEIQKRIRNSGFNDLVYHSQIPSLGQYSWVIGSKSQSSSAMRAFLEKVSPKVSTTWWNQEAMNMMLSFGKTSYFLDMAIQNTSQQQ